jgi:hypothetical protein
MRRLLLLTDTQLPALPTAADDSWVLLGPALALLWQQPVASALHQASKKQLLFALAAELEQYPAPPLTVQVLANHGELAERIEQATAVITGG